MGVETAGLVVAAVAAAGEAYSQTQAAGLKQKSLDLQAKQSELQTQQKTLENFSVMQKVLDAQEAHMTVTGTAFSSPSFNAIQRNTLNIGNRKGRNTAIEGELEVYNNEIEKAAVQQSLYAQLFGDAAQATGSIAAIYNKMPSKKA